MTKINQCNLKKLCNYHIVRLQITMRHLGKLVEAMNSMNHLFYKEESKIERKINAQFLSFHKET
jgi:hypothetical protein